MKYLRLYLLILRTFGLRVRPLGTFLLLALQRMVQAVTGAADHLLHPTFSRQPLDRPVFILGHPRSGTTFMHRFLLQTEAFCAFELWEMLLPAITGRRLLHRFVDRFARFSPGRFHSGEAHEAGVRDVETDDALVLFHLMDGGFLWSYFWAWHDDFAGEQAQRVFRAPGAQSQPPQDATFAVLDAAWRRNVYYKRKSRILAKSSLLSLRPEELVARYPDCKILYLVRDPLLAIPSGMSLLTGVLGRSYGIDATVAADRRAHYLDNLYQASCSMYGAFHAAWQQGRIPERNLHIVRYDQLTGDLSGTLDAVLRFLEVEASPAFAAAVAEQHGRQAARQSGHAYSLERFGLSADRIAADLDFVYRSYGVARS